MKTRLKIPLLFIFVIFINCTSDDSAQEDMEENISDSINGTYEITSLTTRIPYDLNSDGNASIELMDELDCISGTLVIENEENWTTTNWSGWFVVGDGFGGIEGFDCEPTSSNSNSSNSGLLNNVNVKEKSFYIFIEKYYLEGNTLTLTNSRTSLEGDWDVLTLIREN